MSMPEELQTYIDIAWEAHAEELRQLNNAIEVRAWVDGIIAQHEARLKALAEQAGKALPWAPEVEKQAAQ